MNETHIAKETVTMIVPPNVMTMMSGVKYAKIHASGLTQLTYTDDTTESAFLSAERLTEGRENFFRLVSGVQEQRKA